MLRAFLPGARRRGYRWVGDECVASPQKVRELSPNDFLPRRLMGEWLNWSYHTLVAVCPGQVSVRHRPASAVDVEAVDGRELVRLADGRTLLLVDQVILTTGHTPDHPRQGDESRPLSPCPVPTTFGSSSRSGHCYARLLASAWSPSTSMLRSLSVWEGRSTGCDGRLRYQGGGEEPKLFLFSRSGQRGFAKPTSASDPTREYVPVICTPGRGRPPAHLGGRKEREGAVDFCRDLLPLVTAEMQVRYYRQSAALFDEDPQAADKVARALANMPPGPRANSQLSWKNMLAGTALSISTPHVRRTFRSAKCVSRRIPAFGLHHHRAGCDRGTHGRGREPRQGCL